jgi:hypothetical protein
MRFLLLLVLFACGSSWEEAKRKDDFSPEMFREKDKLAAKSDLPSKVLNYQYYYKEQRRIGLTPIKISELEPQFNELLASSPELTFAHFTKFGCPENTTRIEFTASPQTKNILGCRLDEPVRKCKNKIYKKGHQYLCLNKSVNLNDYWSPYFPLYKTPHTKQELEEHKQIFADLSGQMQKQAKENKHILAMHTLLKLRNIAYEYFPNQPKLIRKLRMVFPEYEQRLKDKKQLKSKYLLRRIGCPRKTVEVLYDQDKLELSCLTKKKSPCFFQVITVHKEEKYCLESYSEFAKILGLESVKKVNPRKFNSLIGEYDTKLTEYQSLSFLDSLEHEMRLYKLANLMRAIHKVRKQKSFLTQVGCSKNTMFFRLNEPAAPYDPRPREMGEKLIECYENRVMPECPIVNPTIIRGSKKKWSFCQKSTNKSRIAYFGLYPQNKTKDIE